MENNLRTHVILLSFHPGMNTGVQDAHNLAWKIASVLDGITSASFLSTYEMERKLVTNFSNSYFECNN